MLRSPRGKNYIIMNRLILIDAYAIIHRAFHAYPALTTPNGQLVNAVYGFTAMLLKVIDELKPTHLIVCFDLPVPTFRHEAYIGYQASRPSTHEDIKSQVDLVREVVEAAGIPIFASPGFEADDVIGTLASQVTKEQKAKNIKHKKDIEEVIIVTGDRDMLQLVTDRVKVYMPIKGVTEARLLGKDGVKEYLGIEPEKVVDYKGLTGDSSDNYPGVPGIGPKTAIALLERYGSLGEIYNQLKIENGKLENFSEATGNKLLDGYDLAMLSQKLARISTDVPIGFDLGKAKLHDLKGNEKFTNKLKELNFRSLLGRLGVAAPVVPKKPRNNDQMELV